MKLMRIFEDVNLDKAFSEIQSLGPRHPFMRGEIFVDNDVMVNVTKFEGKIHLASILTFEDARGKGKASEALKKIIDICDKHGVVMMLGPEPFGRVKGLNKSQLISWYKRYGFEKDTYGGMIRYPKGGNPSIKLSGKFKDDHE